MTQPVHWRLAIAVWLITGALTPAGAQTTTNQSASLLIFPRVMVNAAWETTIQLSNNANRPARAVCYYVNGGLTFPDLPPGPINPPLWTSIDFRLQLNRQQPTHWVVSRGRAIDEADGACTAPFESCDGTGFDPGIIPPVDAAFTGALLCYEVDASGAPWSGNAFSGHATLTHLETGEVVKYPAVGSLGLPTNDADGTLCLGGEPGEVCPDGAEYRGCPASWTISHPSDDDNVETGRVRSTRLTIVPCRHDFLTQQAQTLTLQFEIINELEQRFTTSAQVTCWADHRLTDISPLFGREVLGADAVQTRVRTTESSAAGFVVVQQTELAADDPDLLWLAATVPPQLEGEARADLIRLPDEAPR
jgi:hypothetical protein